MRRAQCLSSRLRVLDRLLSLDSSAGSLWQRTQLLGAASKGEHACLSIVVCGESQGDSASVDAEGPILSVS